MQRLKFAAGATIFAEGDASDRAYLIRAARVEIVRRTAQGSVRFAVLGEGLTEDARHVYPSSAHGQ